MTALDLYLRLPWTVESTKRVDDGEEAVVLSVLELDFLVVGQNEADAAEKFWPALSMLLESYVEDGVLPPLPETAMIVDPVKLEEFVQASAKTDQDTISIGAYSAQPTTVVEAATLAAA